MTTKTVRYRTFTTRNGLSIHTRQMQPEDAPYLVEIFENMSADSRYRRFHQPVENISTERKWQEAERIAHIDPQKSGGIIAFANLPGKGNVAIAAARFVRVSDEVAEAAVSVIDAMQQQGVGTQLMNMLIEVAQVVGIWQLVASVQNDNQGIMKILQRLPYEVKRVAEGSFATVTVNLRQRREPAALQLLKA